MIEFYYPAADVMYSLIQYRDSLPKFIQLRDQDYENLKRQISDPIKYQKAIRDIKDHPMSWSKYIAEEVYLKMQKAGFISSGYIANPSEEQIKIKNGIYVF